MSPPKKDFDPVPDLEAIAARLTKIARALEIVVGSTPMTVRLRADVGWLERVIAKAKK